jgi:hypothetical protein
MFFINYHIMESYYICYVCMYTAFAMCACTLASHSRMIHVDTKGSNRPTAPHREVFTGVFSARLS